MIIKWDIWFIRAFFCLGAMIFVFIARSGLCSGVASARDVIRNTRKDYRPLDTGRQPRFIVWLLYTDIRSVRNQSFPLRLNMIMCIAAFFYIVSEFLFGWLPLTFGMCISLAILSVFFGVCLFIGCCIENKLAYGHYWILLRKYAPSKYDSSIKDLLVSSLFFVLARCYFLL